MFNLYINPCLGRQNEQVKGLLDVALDKVLAVDADRTIIVGKNKKPRLKSGAVHFNVSHCSNFVSCALSDISEVGVDVETVSSRVLRLKKRLVFLDELESFEDLDEKTQINLLTRRWTEFESFFKFTGEGIGRFFSKDLPRLERIANGRPKEGDFEAGFFVHEGQRVFVYTKELEGAFLSVAALIEEPPSFFED